jgi:alpha-1,2-mannosyltransferase
VQGQNGALTASLAGLALLCLDRRPALAGVFIGLLAIKPHLAIFFPVALAAAGLWRTMLAAAVTATLFAALSIAILGIDTVPAFIGAIGHMTGLLEKGALQWWQMPSLFAALRMAGISVHAAWLAHVALAALATGALVCVWRRCADIGVRAVALVAATFLGSPYVYHYDEVWFALPIAFLTIHAARTGWLRGEREILLLAWCYPLAGNVLAARTGVNPGPLFSCVLLALALRRAYRPPAAGVAQHHRDPLANRRASSFPSPDR